MADYIVTQENGTWARESFGPKKVFSGSQKKTVPSIYDIVIDVSGDDLPVIDITDQTLTVVPPGAMILEAFARSEGTDAAVAVTVGDGTSTAAVNTFDLSATNAWVRAESLDVNVTNASQFAVTGVSAGETATIVIRVLQGHPTSVDGVMAKA